MHFREATEGDIPQIMDVGLEDTKKHTKLSPSQLMEYIRRKDSTVFLAEYQDEVIGYAVLQVVNPTPTHLVPKQLYAQIYEFYIQENQRQIGQHLYFECMKWAKKNGARTMQIK